jgi:hypothetical protein
VLAPVATDRVRPGPPAARDYDGPEPPPPEVVLTHLERVGVYERGGGAAPAWEKGQADRSRGAGALLALLFLLSGSGAGAYFYAKKLEAGRLAEARELERATPVLLRSGRSADLRATDDRLSRIFELDSHSRVAAELWLENRVYSALFLPDEPRGIEAAIRRCQALGVPDKDLAFARVASFLTEGDLAGAAALLTRWDSVVSGDARYHLVAATMLERAGDLRAIGRYKQAAEAEPALPHAVALHAQLVALELGAEEASGVVAAARERLGDRPEGKALGQLLWAVGSPRDEALPAGLTLSDAERGALPVPMAFVPLAVDALLAADGAARAGFTRALAATGSPAQATWVGTLAVERGEGELARRAGLKALGYAGLYPRARALAARVALLESRLEDALGAIQELDPSTPEVAAVRAAAAYEALNLGELESAVAAMGEDAQDRPLGRALSRGVGVAMGQAPLGPELIATLAVPEVPWGALIAVDAALDQGDLTLAGTVADAWGEQRSLPPYALRLARLERYRKNPDAAVTASAVAAEGGMTQRTLVERFYALVQARQIAEARELLAKYPAVLGPTTAWLQAHLDVLGGQTRRAKAFVGGLEAPPPEAPLLHRVLAARTLTLVGDRRGRGYVGDLFRLAGRHPDVLEAGRAVGVVR